MPFTFDKSKLRFVCSVHGNTAIWVECPAAACESGYVDTDQMCDVCNGTGGHHVCPECDKAEPDLPF